MCYYITVADLGNCNAVVAERQTRYHQGLEGGPQWLNKAPIPQNENLKA